MRIQHNISAMNSYRNFTANNSALNRNLEKLSTGYKINRAGDDAAGLAISEKMRAQISGLEGATKNAKDGISLIQTAEGALTEVHSMLNRMTTLAEQSANGTYQDELDREQLQKEVSALKEEIDRIADSTNFNGLKLLDGSLTDSKKSIEIAEGTSVNSKSNGINMTDGVTINAPTDGAGNKQTYSMEFSADTLFGAGDSMTLKFKDTTDSSTDTFTVSYNSTVSDQHLQFNGDNLKDQLDSIAKALNFHDTVGSNDGIAYKNDYTASVEMNDDGSGKIILTANEANKPGYTFEDVTITDTQSTSTATKTAASVTANSTALDAKDIKLLGGDDNSFYVNSGDTLTFKFQVNGKDMYAQITEGEDFFLESSDTLADKTDKIVDALQNAKFLDPDGEQIVPASTGAATTAAIAPTETKTVDESMLKVSDYFNITANKDADGGDVQGAVQFTQNTTKMAIADGAYVDVSNAYLTNSGSNSAKNIGANVGSTHDDPGAAGTVTAEKTEIALTDAEGAGTASDMSVGEKFVVSGTLADGRSFSMELSAVKAGTADDDLGENEFALGGTFATTVNKITAALVNENNVVTITNEDGTDGGTLAASDLFATSGTDTDFVVSKTGNTITITNTAATTTGKGLAASLDDKNSGVKAGDEISTTLEPVSKGSEMASSENLITFDASAIEQGTTLEIDGKTYEFVTDASYTTKSDNVAVVVDGLGDSATDEDIANALVGAMEGDTAGVYTAANGGDYNMTVSGNKLTISSADTGEGVEALSIKMGENKATTVLNVATTDAGTVEDPDKVELNVKVGDTVQIGSKTYEFTAGKGTQNVDNIAVSLLDDEGEMMTEAADVAQRLADVVNAEAGEGSSTEAGIVARADGGKVILTGKYDALAAKNGTDPYAAPNIAFAGGSRKLTLQIGDTADSYNQLSVEISDMHAEGLGIGDVDVSNQESAAAALDKIKEAVNRVSDTRGTLGALQNRLDHTINNLGVMRENIQNAESQIRDTDVAEEMMEYTKNNILNQSAQAMLAQANQLPQGVLQLLG